MNLDFKRENEKKKRDIPSLSLHLYRGEQTLEQPWYFPANRHTDRYWKRYQNPRMIGPMLPCFCIASQRRTASFGYYPSHSAPHPPKTPFNRSIPPWIWKGVGLDWRVKEGARSPKPKISTKTFPPTTHNTNRTQPFVLKNRLWKLKSADKHGEIQAFAKQKSSTCLAV